jgi:hypothetical protein
VEDSASMHRRSVAVSTLVLVAALLFVTAAPAGASGTDPATWAQKFCTAVGNWQTKLQQESSKIENASPSSIAEGKKAIVTFLGNAVTLTKQAISAAKKAGVPDAPNGKKISDTLVAALKKAQALFSKAQSQAKSLPTNDPAKFAAAGKNIGTSLEKSGTALANSFKKVSSLDTGQKLGTALAAEPSCASI